MNSKDCVIFFDFDNTITAIDVIDDMVARFSKDDRWIELEKLWQKGKIGSRQCLRGQIGGVRITRDKLNGYLSRVKLDPYFKRLLKLLRSRKIKTVVLSDNFDYMLKNILKANGVEGVKVHSNRLRLSRDRLIPSFPSANKNCAGSCGHCKTKSLKTNSNGHSTVVYIGDGRSDICPARSADIVFAKASLLKHFKEKKMPHIPFKGLKDVHEYFTRSLA